MCLNLSLALQFFSIKFFQSAGVQFPQSSSVVPSSHPPSQENQSNTLNGQLANARHERSNHPQQLEPQSVPESRYLSPYLYLTISG